MQVNAWRSKRQAFLFLQEKQTIIAVKQLMKQEFIFARFFSLIFKNEQSNSFSWHWWIGRKRLPLFGICFFRKGISLRVSVWHFCSECIGLFFNWCFLRIVGQIQLVYAWTAPVSYHWLLRWLYHFFFFCFWKYQASAGCRILQFCFVFDRQFRFGAIGCIWRLVSFKNVISFAFHFIVQDTITHSKEKFSQNMCKNKSNFQ